MDASADKKELPTLEDVARAAGVSTATVSRCLNSPHLVSEKTRDRILAAVAELRYSPNFGARALAAKRTNTYGAVIPTMDNAIFARGLQAFQEGLGGNGATLLVASSSYDPKIEEDQIRTLVARGADGLLLIGNERSAEIYEFLRERGIAHVIAWTLSRDPERHSVGFDNVGATRALAKKAISLGHRRLAFISARTAANDRARDRVAGAQRALEDAGLDPASMVVVETEYSFKCGKDAFRSIMQASDRPTLVMCGNDVLAVGAVQAAREMGIDVPTEVSITGFDDIELATVVSPALTTVHVPHRRMGELAAEILLRPRHERERAVHHALETHIVERETLAAPRDGG